VPKQSLKTSQMRAIRGRRRRLASAARRQAADLRLTHERVGARAMGQCTEADRPSFFTTWNGLTGASATTRHSVPSHPHAIHTLGQVWGCCGSGTRWDRCGAAAARAPALAPAPAAVLEEGGGRREEGGGRTRHRRPRFALAPQRHHLPAPTIRPARIFSTRSPQGTCCKRRLGEGVSLTCARDCITSSSSAARGSVTCLPNSCVEVSLA
jgi:hypothetical protein